MMLGMLGVRCMRVQQVGGGIVGSPVPGGLQGRRSPPTTTQPTTANPPGHFNVQDFDNNEPFRIEAELARVTRPLRQLGELAAGARKGWFNKE